MNITIKDDKELLIEHFGDLKTKILFQQTLQHEFDGYSFIVSLENQIEVLVIYYEGENELTENMEGYFNIFITDISVVYNLSAIMEKIIYRFEQEQPLQWIYLRIYSECKDLYNILLSEKLNFMKGCILSSLLIKNKVNKLPYENLLDKNISIRNGTQNDVDNIINCLIQAYLNPTQQEQLKSIDELKFIENIKNYYKDLLNTNRLILVAEFNNEFCGHISYDISYQEKEASMIDIFVIDKFSGLGIEPALIGRSQETLEKIGIYKVHGTVDNSEGIDQAFRVFKSLSNKGWELDGLIFYIDPLKNPLY